MECQSFTNIVKRLPLLSRQQFRAVVPCIERVWAHENGWLIFSKEAAFDIERYGTTVLAVLHGEAINKLEFKSSVAANSLLVQPGEGHYLRISSRGFS